MLFLLTGGTVLWIGGQFFYDLNHYFHFSASAPAVLDKWEVKEEKGGKFSIGVNYQFEWEGQTVYGVYNFSKPSYHNPYVAKDHIKEWEAKSWTVWFDPKKPNDGSLQKKFPAKKAIHFALSLAILFYFTFLKAYVRRMNILDQSSS